MVQKIYLAAIIILICSFRVEAQSRGALEEDAYKYLNSQEYAKAYVAFDQLHSRYPREMIYEFNLGVCCLFYPEKKDRAIEIFKSLKAKYKTVEAEAYLGLAFHKNYKFEEALAILRPMEEQLAMSKRKEDKKLLEDVKMTIMNCENGLVLIQNKVIADIQNIGAPVNSPETEGAPVITADESVMMYTYIGKNSIGGKMDASLSKDPEGVYTSDIYMSTKDASGSWGPPEPVNSLNNKAHNSAVALSPDGLTLFTFLSNNKNEGDLQVSSLNGKEFTPPVSLNENINTPEYWEGSCSISADGKYLYFSSERPSGMGGRDIYVSELTNGDWGPAVNLGPKVNTIYDDDAPFIHPDGITLFFSSKGHTSIGGYDIMFTIKEGNDWTEPKSMGIPLNTVEDDSYYVINSKGDKGYFSSGRAGKGGLGELDIYMVTPGILGEKPIVALLKGTVYGNDKPIEAKIEVVKTAKQEQIGPYHSNKETGKYLTALSPGYIYRIKVTADGYSTVEEDFDIENLSSFMEKTKDFYLYTPEAAPNKTVEVAKEVLNAVDDPTVTAVVTTNEEPQATTNEGVITPPKEEMKTEVVTEEPVLDEKKQEVITKAEEKKNEVVAKTNLKPTKEKPVKEKPKAEKPRQSETTASEETDAVVTSPCEKSLPNISELKGKSLNDIQWYNRMLELVGDYCDEKIVFSVQIGAYKKPENYKYKNLKDLGKVKSESYPDGVTRFTQKQFNTIREAEKLRQKAIARGQKDAWIVAFVDGKRYTLEDLIMVDFLGTPVN